MEIQLKNGDNKDALIKEQAEKRKAIYKKFADDDRFKNMLQGIASAEQLIQKLGLDDEIILFLQNTNAGKASLLDLNDKVLNWIRSEKLENKIRVSFVRK